VNTPIAIVIIYGAGVTTTPIRETVSVADQSTSMRTCREPSGEGPFVRDVAG